MKLCFVQMAQEACDAIYLDAAENEAAWVALGLAEKDKDADSQLDALWASMGSRKTQTGLKLAIDNLLNH